MEQKQDGALEASAQYPPATRSQSRPIKSLLIFTILGSPQKKALSYLHELLQPRHLLQPPQLSPPQPSPPHSCPSCFSPTAARGRHCPASVSYSSWSLGHRHRNDPSTFSQSAVPHTATISSHSFTSAEQGQRWVAAHMWEVQSMLGSPASARAGSAGSTAAENSLVGAGSCWGRAESSVGTVAQSKARKSFLPCSREIQTA